MNWPQILQTATLVGLCPLIPFPFLDELARRHLQGRAWAQIGEAAGRPMDPATLRTLSRGKGNMVLGCLLAVLWWPIKKLFRTFIYVLTVKDCVDWAAESIIRTVLVRDALSRGLLPERASEVRASMDKAIEARFGSPILNLIKGRRPPPPSDWEGGGDLQRWLATLAGLSLIRADFVADLTRLLPGPTDP